VRIKVDVHAYKDKTGENVQDKIPPETSRLLGAANDTVPGFESFPAQHEKHWHGQQNDPTQQEPVLAIDEIRKMVHWRVAQVSL
jgi:hypothetical protein